MLFGRPLVEPIDDIPPDGEVPAALGILAEDFVAHDYDLVRLISLIAFSEPFQVDSRMDADELDHRLATAREESWAVFPITRLRPEQVVGSLLQSSALKTIDYQSHILVRIGRAIGRE